jgi:hypothetical protein
MPLSVVFAAIGFVVGIATVHVTALNLAGTWPQIVALTMAGFAAGGILDL